MLDHEEDKLQLLERQNTSMMQALELIAVGEIYCTQEFAEDILVTLGFWQSANSS